MAIVTPDRLAASGAFNECELALQTLNRRLNALKRKKVRGALSKEFSMANLEKTGNRIPEHHFSAIAHGLQALAKNIEECRATLTNRFPNTFFFATHIQTQFENNKGQHLVSAFVCLNNRGEIDVAKVSYRAVSCRSNNVSWRVVSCRSSKVS